MNRSIVLENKESKPGLCLGFRGEVPQAPR